MERGSFVKNYIISLDQGTTSSRAIIFDRQQNIVEIAQKEFTQLYPKPGYVEHDPMEIYASQYGVMIEVLAKSGIDVYKRQAAGSRSLSSSGWKGAVGPSIWGWALLAAGTAGASLADPAAQYVPGGNGGSP